MGDSRTVVDNSKVVTVMLVSYFHTLNYTESNCIHVVGGSKMPIYEAKQEYILYYLYLLS